MTRVAYFDCFAGASGDMILGALVDAGVSLDELRAALGKLPVTGYDLRFERVTRASLASGRVHVDLDGRPQPQRSLADITAIIASSGLPPVDRERGIAIFQRLADAEAAVHGVGPEEVHFHEVGALDAIVDVMGAVVGLRLLGIEACFVSSMPSGSGSARSAHGSLPVPAPATLELLSRAGAPIRQDGGERGELVTPTAAAVLTTLGLFERPPLTLDRVGYGAGSRDPAEYPNVLRIWVGTTGAAPTRQILQIETNIDDMPAEQFGYVQERLFAVGALDVWFTPVQMKKNRPAAVISALCPAYAESALVEVLLRETTTLGVRLWKVRRHEVERESVTFVSSLGDVGVKLKRLPGERARVAPEYESCRAIALRTGLPLADVYRIVASEAEDRFAGAG
jgi:pyridinium-3,5-bisthiocarboxylic acid mononucleotide nickel chelatase